jgi:hypothetical protein
MSDVGAVQLNVTVRLAPAFSAGTWLKSSNILNGQPNVVEADAYCPMFCIVPVMVIVSPASYSALSPAREVTVRSGSGGTYFKTLNEADRELLLSLLSATAPVESA